MSFRFNRESIVFTVGLWAVRIVALSLSVGGLIYIISHPEDLRPLSVPVKEPKVTTVRDEEPQAAAGQNKIPADQEKPLLSPGGKVRSTKPPKASATKGATDLDGEKLPEEGSQITSAPESKRQPASSPPSPPSQIVPRASATATPTPLPRESSLPSPTPSTSPAEDELDTPAPPASAHGASPSPLPPGTSVTPPPPQAKKKGNAVKRFFKWLVNLFRRKKDAEPEPDFPRETPRVAVEADPAVLTICPDSDIAPQMKVHLKATVKNLDATKLRFSWYVTDGSIEGKGPEVSWDLASALPGTYTVVASAGYCHEKDVPGCNGAAEFQVTVRACPPPSPTPFFPPSPSPTPTPTPFSAPTPIPIDTFVYTSPNDYKARLDNFAHQLQNSPGAQGYIIIYGTCAGRADRITTSSREYLVNTRGIDPARIVVIDGGCHETNRVELWEVMSGALAPAANPTRTCQPCTIPVDADGAETPSPSPTPTPTPGETPTPPRNLDKELKERDHVTIRYPVSLCYRSNAHITVTYDRKTGEIKVDRVETGNNANISIIPAPPPGTSGPVTLAVPGAEVYATAKLVAQGFDITDTIGPATLPLGEVPVGGAQWKWQIKPKSFNTGDQNVNVNIALEFRDKQTGAAVKTWPNWVNEDFAIKVSILTNGETATVSAICLAVFAALFGTTWKVIGLLSAVLVASPRNVFNIWAKNIGQVGENNRIENLTQAAPGEEPKGEAESEEEEQQE